MLKKNSLKHHFFSPHLNSISHAWHVLKDNNYIKSNYNTK